MTKGGLGTGLSPARGDQVLGLTAAQLGVRNLGASQVKSPNARDRVYTSNEELWHALLGEHLRATAVVVNWKISGSRSGFHYHSRSFSHTTWPTECVQWREIIDWQVQGFQIES